MVCYNCGKDIKGVVITQEDGTTWCYVCKKAEMKRPETLSVAKTKDPFVKIVRKLRKIGSFETGFFSGVFMCQGSKRMYTNGHVLISEMENIPDKYKLVNIDSLRELSKGEQFEYPSIEKALKLRSAFENDIIVIPEDFYRYAEAFNKSKYVRVKIRREGIIIVDCRDDSKMVYGEFKVPLDGEADFDSRYFMLLKPHEILVDSEVGSARIESNYAEGLENCVHVFIMPLAKEG
jgi:hypothetical protein